MEAADDAPGPPRERLPVGDVILVALLTLAALALRHFLSTRSGLWGDEALFLYVVRLPGVGDILTFLREHESHPPLFYLLMRGWLRVFGDTEASALALPVLLGGMMVPAAWHAGRRMFGRSAGLTAALLAALSATLADGASYVRPYSLLPLLGLGSLYLLWRALYGGNGVRAWLPYVAVTAAMLYTHNWSVLLLAGQWVTVAALLVIAGKTLGDGRRALLGFLAAQTAIGLLYAPWVPALLDQAAHAGHGPGSPPRLLATLMQFATILLPLPYQYATVAWLLLGAALAVTAFLARRRPDVASDPAATPVSPPGSGVAVALLLGAPLAAFCLAMLLNTRSLLLIPRPLGALAPGPLIVFAAGLTHLPGRPLYRLLAALVAAFGLGYTTLSLTGLDKSNARELAAQVDREARPTDLILISPEQARPAFNLYLRAPNEHLDYPEHRRVGTVEFDDWAARFGRREHLERARQALAEARRNGRRVWLITSEGWILPQVPEDDQRTDPELLTTVRVGALRTSQLMVTLQRLYGPPTRVYTPGKDQADDEVLIALLFEPSAPAPPRSP